jgi:hypothetical protein
VKLSGAFRVLRAITNEIPDSRVSEGIQQVIESAANANTDSTIITTIRIVEYADSITWMVEVDHERWKPLHILRESVTPDDLLN